MSKTVYEITDSISLMPVEGTTEYASESEALKVANDMGLQESEYIITWCEVGHK